MDKSDDIIKAKSQNNTDDIIAAIRRIMEAEDVILKDDPDTKLMSLEAQKRIYAALDRLTGGQSQSPTVLEALILEALQPLLGDWLDANMPPMVERLVREEIRAHLARSEKQMSREKATTAET